MTTPAVGRNTLLSTQILTCLREYFLLFNTSLSPVPGKTWCENARFFGPHITSFMSIFAFFYQDA